MPMVLGIRLDIGESVTIISVIEKSVVRKGDIAHILLADYRGNRWFKTTTNFSGSY
jgi:hypothetical protein